MKTTFKLEVDGLSTRGRGGFTLKDLSFKIKNDECWAIAGATGSGKTTLLKAIEQYKYYPRHINFGEKTDPTMAFISHQHRFKSMSGVNNFYYQQRFNSPGSDDSVTVIEDLLSRGGSEPDAQRCLEELQIEYLKDTPLIQLSNGEHQRYQISRALFGRADWLLLDNPFAGLDENARMMLELVLEKVMEKGVQVLMASEKIVPAFVTHVAVLDDGILTGIYQRNNFLKAADRKVGKPIKIAPVTYFLDNPECNDFEVAVSMKDVTVRYHGKDILRDVTWKVKKGESWSVSGANGSGKSTLLSLINGDNPQAFANEIYLFDRRRGSGETIWEIKSRIGFISPELHHHFDRSATCYDTVASGFFDTVGLFKKLSRKQSDTVSRCMSAFDIDAFAARPLGSLSFGLQRWVLLARAIIKNPPLLILDEPCQGLDDNLKERFLYFIEDVCAPGDRTLIYVTHLDDEIPSCITHYLTLDKGKIKAIKEHGKEYHGDRRGRDRA